MRQQGQRQQSKKVQTAKARLFPMPINAGFTLVELMTVIAIMGILAAMAYPSMQKQIAQQRLKEAVTITETLLKQARSDALISRSQVTSVIDTAAKTITISQSINGIPNTQTTKYNTNIVIGLANSMPSTIRFTPDKRVYSDVTGTNPLANDGTLGYTFCYTGVSSTKYLLTVDAMTNVRVVASGVCS